MTTDEMMDKITKSADADVSTVEVDLALLAERGVLVDVSVNGTSMFVTRASWDDLGIPESYSRERLTRACKNMVPRSYLKRVHTLQVRFRNVAEKYSVGLDYFHPYRYVPYTAWAEFRREWDKLQGEWATLKSEMLELWDNFRQVAEWEFEDVARDAYQTLLARLSRQGRTPESGEEAFVKAVVSSAMLHFPSRERVEQDLRASYRVRFISAVGGSSLATVDGTSAVYATKSAIHEYVQEQVAGIESEVNAEIKERREQIAAMREEAMAAARREMAELGSPVNQLFDQVRAQIFEDVAEIAAGLRKNGTLMGRSAERAESLAKTFSLFNVHNDWEMRNALDQLRGLVQAHKGAPKGMANSTPIAEKLQEIQEMTHQSVINERRRGEIAARSGLIEVEL